MKRINRYEFDADDVRQALIESLPSDIDPDADDIVLFLDGQEVTAIDLVIEVEPGMGACGAARVRASRGDVAPDVVHWPVSEGSTAKGACGAATEVKWVAQDDVTCPECLAYLKRTST